jgi:DNA-binding MarR family transcriptional regulator
LPGLPTVEQQQHHQPADDSLCPSEALYLLMAVVVGRVPRNMSLTQLSTLSTLADGGPRRITDLAAIQGVAQPSITEMVAILERAGYVERHRDPLDGRASLAALTAAGRDCLRDRRRIASQSLAQLVAMLPAAERAALNAAVPALVHLRELDGGAVRSADAGHGPVVDRIGHQGMTR